MHCLYLAEDYIGSKVHHQLCAAIDEQNQGTMTLFAVRRRNGKTKDLTTMYAPVHYSTFIADLTSSHLKYKYFFKHKIKVKEQLLLSKTDIKQYDLIHAATLFSEGALAFSLFKKYNIPYCVSVRGSDINFYFKKMPHLWLLGKEILKNAKSVIFISPYSQKKLFKIKFLKPILKNLSAKSVIIPNGIEDFWHQNLFTPQEMKNPYSLLYVGRFDKNKNILSLIEAVRRLRSEKPELQLTLIGGKGSKERKVLDLVKKYDWLHYKGEIYKHEELLLHYRQHHIFSMVSHSETFGLVYLEALSQGVPVIYTAKQGFDGIFKELEIGYGVDSKNIQNIMENIQKVIENYHFLQKNIANIPFSQFEWKNIAMQYNDLYKSILSEKMCTFAHCS
ncbi:MAG TPA: glycosyltransferase family 4 protein [Bacteroidales bacterium]|nr:glycosyltransferase family 4 protein [Bacteroidales bacterium]